MRMDDDNIREGYNVMRQFTIGIIGLIVCAIGGIVILLGLK